MDNWAFFDRNGDEITRGWQGTEGQAREHAQALADNRKLAIEFQRESDLTGYRDTEGVIHETPLDGEVVKPRAAQESCACCYGSGYVGNGDVPCLVCGGSGEN